MRQNVSRLRNFIFLFCVLSALLRPEERIQSTYLYFWYVELFSPCLLSISTNQTYASLVMWPIDATIGSNMHCQKTRNPYCGYFWDHFSCIIETPEPYWNALVFKNNLFCLYLLTYPRRCRQLLWHSIALFGRIIISFPWTWYSPIIFWRLYFFRLSRLLYVCFYSVLSVIHSIGTAGPTLGRTPLCELIFKLVKIYYSLKRWTYFALCKIFFLFCTDIITWPTLELQLLFSFSNSKSY